MNPDKNYLHQAARQQPADDTPPAHRRKSKTAAASNSRKRADHKHAYRKIILHFGGDAFSWGRQCTLCGRIDDAFKPSLWGGADFAVTGAGQAGSWSACCLAEIHARYPDTPLFTRQNAAWQPWPAE